MQALAAGFPDPEEAVEGVSEIAVLIGAAALMFFLWFLIAMAANELAKKAARKLKERKQSERTIRPVAALS